VVVVVVVVVVVTVAGSGQPLSKNTYGLLATAFTLPPARTLYSMQTLDPKAKLLQLLSALQAAEQAAKFAVVPDPS
jgi:hypothetical protein